MDELVPISSLSDQIAGYGPTRRIQVLVASWLAAYDSYHTQRAYARDIKAWLAFCDEKDLDPLQAIRAHLDLWKQAGAGYSSGAKNTSIARRISAVSSWYDYLVQEDVLDRNPAANVKRPHVDPYYTATRGLSEEQARDMIQAAGSDGLRSLAVITILILNGLRVAELVLADIDDLGHEQGHRTVDVTRKGGAIQRIPLTEPAALALDTYLGGRESGPLVVTESGARISPFQVYRLVQKIAKAAGIFEPEGITPHSCRHTFVTLALDAGAALEDVQDAVGHRDPKTTIRYNRARNRLSKNPTHKLTERLLGKDEEAS